MPCTSVPAFSNINGAAAINSGEGLFLPLAASFRQWHLPSEVSLELLREAILLEVGVDDAKELASFLEGQLFQLLEPAFEPLTGLAVFRLRRAFLANKLVDRDAEGLG